MIFNVIRDNENKYMKQDKKKDANSPIIAEEISNKNNICDNDKFKKNEKTKNAKKNKEEISISISGEDEMVLKNSITQAKPLNIQNGNENSTGQGLIQIQSNEKNNIITKGNKRNNKIMISGNKNKLKEKDKEIDIINDIEKTINEKSDTTSLKGVNMLVDVTEKKSINIVDKIHDEKNIGIAKVKSAVKRIDYYIKTLDDIHSSNIKRLTKELQDEKRKKAELEHEKFIIARINKIFSNLEADEKGNESVVISLEEDDDEDNSIPYKNRRKTKPKTQVKRNKKNSAVNFLLQE